MSNPLRKHMFWSKASGRLHPLIVPKSKVCILSWSLNPVDAHSGEQEGAEQKAKGEWPPASCHCPLLRGGCTRGTQGRQQASANRHYILHLQGRQAAIKLALHPRWRGWGQAHCRAVKILETQAECYLVLTGIF